MRRFSLSAILALTALTAACSVDAEPLRDGVTGLAIDPPEGYVASVTTPTGQYSAAFDVVKPEDTDTGCRVAFQNAPQNAALTQDEINAFVTKPEWADLVRNGLSSIYDVRSFGLFEHAGVRGATALAEFKPRPDFPARSQEVSTIFFLQETPKGRTTVVCVCDKTALEARRSEFERVARAVTPPQ